MASLISLICGFICESLRTKIEQAIKGLDKPHALPNVNFEGTNIYGTFFLKILYLHIVMANAIQFLKVQYQLP